MSNVAVTTLRHDGGRNHTCVAWNLDDGVKVSPDILEGERLGVTRARTTGFVLIDLEDPSSGDKVSLSIYRDAIPDLIGQLAQALALVERASGKQSARSVPAA